MGWNRRGFLAFLLSWVDGDQSIIYLCDLRAESFSSLIPLTGRNIKGLTRPCDSWYSFQVMIYATCGSAAQQQRFPPAHKASLGNNTRLERSL